MRVVAFAPEHLAGAVTLFRARLRRLRRLVPSLPARLTQASDARELLAGFLRADRCLVALEDGRMVGYLGWREYESFRGVPSRAAYSPEFGHAAARGREVEAYRALYRAASGRWFDAGCRIHCLTDLAGDASLARFWFASGFGELGQDALRPLPGPPVLDSPTRPVTGRDLRVRAAGAADIPALARLDAEHVRHYADPPVLMVPQHPETEADLSAFLAQPPNAYWLVEAAGEPQGFLRFEAESHGAARISLAPDTISITGAFVRPAWRARGAATAMLAGAVAHHAAQGFQRMAVDYETINPEALAFWPRHFAVVASSYVRVPERA